MSAIDNGRKSLSELQEQFDKVVIRYFPGKTVDNKGVTRETVKTMVALVSGTTVHFGVAKWSNRGFQFSRAKGRAMALGRAEIAYLNNKDLAQPRKAHYSGTDPLAYTISVQEPTHDNIVAAFFGVEELNSDLN